MTAVRRRWAALTLTPLLVIGLAACAPETVEAEPTPVATPSSTPSATPVGPTPLGSRVPLDCPELGESALPGGAPVQARLQDSLYARALWEQSGFLECEYSGPLGAASVTALLFVSIDPSATDFRAYLDASSQFQKGIAGSDSYSLCHIVTEGGYCWAEALAGRYGFELFITSVQGVDATFAGSVADVLSRLVALAEGWPEPAEPWAAPDDALRWSPDCEGEVRANQDVLRGAVPWPLVDAIEFGSGDGAATPRRATRQVGIMNCSWQGAEGGSVELLLIPGAGWLADTEQLGGTPYALEGATSASLESVSSQVSLEAFIDGSYVVLQVNPPFGSGLDAGPVAVAIMQNLVASF